MDRQAIFVLPIILITYLALLVVFTLSSICDEKLTISDYPKLMNFSCFICFVTVGTMQITQIFYFSQLKDNKPNLSLIKVCLSNLVVCLIAGLSHGATFAFESGGVCKDNFG
jgi:hypothetical protein